MRSKVTVVLLFLNVVLFCYIYYYDRPMLNDLRLREQSRQVLPTEIASMDSFSRTSRTGETVRLEKRPDGWWLAAPYEWPANPNAVSAVHNELQFLKNVTSFAVADLDKSGQTLADYGLANPAYTVEFTAAKKNFKFLIGDDTKTGNRLYVLSPDGDRIHVVSRSLAESIGLPLVDLRAESIFSIKVFEVRSLNIQTNAPAGTPTGAPSSLKVRLRRDANARWSFESPILARAAKTAVETSINALNSLSAKTFLPPTETDLDRTGLAAPRLLVTLEGNARRETLLIGNAAPTAGDYYAKIEDKAIVFTTTVAPELMKVLQSSQEILRDPHVVDFDPATVTSFTITAPGQPEISLQKLEPNTPVAGATAPAASPAAKAPASGEAPQEGWQVITRAPGQPPVTIAGDAIVINNLLRKIQLLEARQTTVGSQVKYGFKSDAPSDKDKEDWGFNRPEREITLNLNTGGGLSGRDPSSLVLQIGVSPNEPGNAFARLTNPSFVYDILPDIIEELPASALQYRQRLLRKLPDGAVVTSLAVVDLATGKTIYSQKLAEGDRAWTAALAMEPEPIRKAVNGILKELGELKAQRFAAATFSSNHADTPAGPRPWRFRVDYTISFAGGVAAQNTPASLLLTERFGGKTQLAGTADFGGVVFSITQELLDSLFPLTYTGDPGPVPAAPTAATAASAAPTQTQTPAPAPVAPATPPAKETRP